MFKRILIANRGEIAMRILRACRELGIEAVAVCSAVDRDAPYVRLADESVVLGAAPPADSYLNIDKIIAAAKSAHAEAVHPGYGFLAENSAFALAVESAGLTFIGPSAESIRLMGDKLESRKLMQRAGVPTVPGRDDLQSVEQFTGAAKELGYPLIIKAAAGGGGKGMRVVLEERALAEAIESAGREALHAFGDERLLIEKYLPAAHHIEFQILGDRHGNLIHLFERECSAQRRHQKIIEEAPSPLLDKKTRIKMGEAALAAARAVNYFNAGTVEFLFDPQTQQYHFLEMNTRLQVEHAITELVAGIDLVQWQIRIAAGERLSLVQSDIVQRGHAIECRIYAEDPANGFLPSTGKLLRYIEPHGPGIRVDSGVAAGDEVSYFYDPLLAKLIVQAENRAAAIERVQNALREFVIHGVITNIDFLQAVLSDEDFAAARVTTRWIDDHFSMWVAAASNEMLIAAALADVLFATAAAPPSVTTAADPYSPWKQMNNYRN